MTPPNETPRITTSRQVTQVPRGSVGAGDGSMSGGAGVAQPLLAGTLLLAAASSTALVAARRRRDA